MVYLNKNIVKNYEVKILATSKQFYNFMLFNQKIINYVKNCVNVKPKIIYKAKKEDNLLKIIYPHINKDINYTLVLYADTPLITKETITHCLDYAMLKELDMCMLPRGFIIKNNLFMYAEFIDHFINNNYSDLNNLKLNMMQFNYNPEDFTAVHNCFSLNEVVKIMQKRINTNHLNNGVIIHDVNSTFIDFTVKIGKNVTIMPNVNILGNSKIGDNCTILHNCVIKNSEVLSDCVLNNCYIENCKIFSGTKIAPYTSLTDNLCPF